MKNYQLYRTNVLLGGQLQLDLVTSSKNGAEIQVDNAHLSPISPMVPFTYSPQENIVLYKHQDNIREFYKKTEGSFYQPFVNPELSHDWPIIYPVSSSEEPEPKRYNDTYIYGCRRMNYNRYSEQFQILVPVWLESVQESLRFEINLYPVSSNNTNPLFHKSLQFKIDDTGTSFNSKLSKYLFDYFKYIRICNDNSGSGNQVININFDGLSSVHGLEVSSGNLTTKELPSLTSNILYRERPLMEVDNMIIESFKNNHMICKQLMNFSICFSMQDFVSPMLTTELLGQPFRVSVDVYVDGQLLEKKDFFNNYEEIGLHKISENGIGLQIERDDPQRSNALLYLKDSKCLDLIDKNKLSQNIIHWSISGQNDYMFNVYGGFGHRNISSQGRNPYCYDVYPESLQKQNYTGSDINNYNWLDYIGLDDVNYLLVNQFESADNTNSEGDPKKIKGFLPLSKKMTVFSSNSGEIIHGVKYENKFKVINKETGDVDYDTIYIAFSYKVGNNEQCSLGRQLCVIPAEGNNITVWDVIGNRNVADDTTGYLSPFKKSKMYLFIIDSKPDINQINRYMKSFLESSTESYDVLNALFNVLSSAVSPKTIVFNRSLAVVYPDSPSKHTTEFRYTKKDYNINNHIIRYDGSITPTFIDKDSMWSNKIYYKTKLTSTEFANSEFKTYGGTKYEPLYPSINYFAIENRSLDKNHYENLDYEEDEKLYISTERPWFDNSQVFYVKNNLEVLVTVNIKESNDVDSLIKEAVLAKIRELYKVTETQATSIYNLYSISMNWEYASNTDIYTYNYYITLNLK